MAFVQIVRHVAFVTPGWANSHQKSFFILASALPVRDKVTSMSVYEQRGHSSRRKERPLTGDHQLAIGFDFSVHRCGLHPRIESGRAFPDDALARSAAERRRAHPPVRIFGVYGFG